MIENILEALAKNNINKYIVSSMEEETLELYLIKKKVDMSRKKHVNLYSVNVLRDFDEEGVEYTGNSEVAVYDTMSDDELNDAIKDAYFSAGFVKNKRYAVPKGVKREKVIKKSSLSEKSMEEIILKIKDALYKYDNFEKGLINSAEIFLTRIDKRIVSSSGTDVSYRLYKTQGEFITQWVDKNDVETYNSFSYEDLNEEELSLLVKEGITNTGYRDEAEEAPDTGKYNVILTDNNVIEFFKYYFVKADTSMIYQKYSDFKLGDKVQGEDIKGDKLNITLKASTPFSDEGIELKERELLKDGVLKNIAGSFKFAQYLGLEPIGEYDGGYVRGGNIQVKDLFLDGELEILRFSDFQMDALTGDFAGEIRLALLKKGDKVIKLTGGSLAANIKDVQNNITLSKEMQNFGAFTVPKAIKLRDVEISGK
ncbi:metallopeptidase TldD-related protein [Inconstantimicrobium porci]|uniref:Metalloprotease TldD/E C-terminal domain-containing protein n=1 Tax=Inconstantimicrobium porci TaxID=2652291 RepID=A0A7X2MVZ0_9CLOT|nr:metallopeptidase TldD-related protein [Inconstantimicrobium porci]MDD6771856.1 metallopeptidase TldD-related protein [Inconstantimicrobium porci]MSR90069.1 hypothetical protein [Inconstantimicrobium porci]